jgi:hypothetical protein
MRFAAGEEVVGDCDTVEVEDGQGRWLRRTSPHFPPYSQRGSWETTRGSALCRPTNYYVGGRVVGTLGQSERRSPYRKNRIHVRSYCGNYPFHKSFRVEPVDAGNFRFAGYEFCSNSGAGVTSRKAVLGRFLTVKIAVSSLIRRRKPRSKFHEGLSGH